MNYNYILVIPITLIVSMWGMWIYFLWKHHLYFKQWEIFALKHNCRMNNFSLFFLIRSNLPFIRPNFPYIQGIRNGHKYRIAIEIDRIPFTKLRKMYTRIYLHFTQPICSPFSITSISLTNRLAMTVGFKDVKTGNLRFDNKFWISGVSPKEIRATLSNIDVLTKISTYLLSFHKKGKITNELVFYEYDKVVPDVATLERIITFMAKMATDIESSISKR